MTFDAPTCSIVIPVYRSAETLPTLMERLVNVFNMVGKSYEVVFVDDGSPEGAWETLQELREQYPGVITAVQLMRNFGQHNAIMCGLRHARGRFILTMDDDLQNPPEEIAKLLQAIETQKLDLVYGVPPKKQHDRWRNLGSGFVNWFFRLVFRIPVTVTSFRIMRRELVDSVLSYNLNFTYIDGLLAWNTQRIGQVTVEHHARKNGRSGYSLAKLLTLAFNLFTNFSLLPLQVATAVGLLAAVGGLVTGTFYTVQALLSNIAVPGYASIIVAVLVLGGLQLLALGIIGEYLGRVHLNINKKPQYTLRQVLEPQSRTAAESESELGEQSQSNDEEAVAGNGTQPRTDPALERKL